MNNHPPKWAERFLKWYCNPLFLEEIEGDIYELFDRRVEVKNIKIARLKFIWDVFRFFRWTNIKRSNSNYSKMDQLLLFGNYMKLGMRNIRKNLTSSSINIFGLAIAICFAISVFVFTDIMLNMDSFLKNRERVYQITNYVEQDGSDALWSDSPIPLGPKLVQDHPTIETFSRVEYRSSSVRFNSDVFDELVLFVDADYFKMFDFSLLGGTRDALSDPGQVVISHNMAVKYFNEEDPVGQVLSFKFGDRKIKKLKVGAVLEKYPYNTSIAYDFFLPFPLLDELKLVDTKKWSYLTDATFIMLKEGEGIGSITDSFDEYKALQLASNPEWKVLSFEPIQFKEVSLRSWEIVSSVSGGAHPAGRIALSVIALFLLGMACFNFMNISVVSASRRLKEIALRKVMGSARREIIKQFLIENILQCFFALFVGTIMAYFILIPIFNIMIPEIDIQFRTSEPMTMVVFLVSLLLGVGLVSGAYPAFYISKFDAITIFRGKQRFGSKNLFSKVMLGLQFFLSVMTIVGCIVFLDQSIYLGSKDWGYDPQGTISVYVSNEEQYQLLRNELLQHPDVLQHTSSDYLIGVAVGVTSLEIENRQLPIRRIGVTEDYIETMGLRLKEGRSLTDRAEDQIGGVIVNEKFVNAMDWNEEAIGKTFFFEDTKRTVVGVIEDFHYYGFFSSIEPVMIHGLKNSNVHYLTIRTDKEKLSNLDVFAREAWQKIAPNDPFDRTFQAEVFDDFYRENKSNISLILLITVIAIILACLGLYGLLAFNVQGKLKEFSVRKVLGAKPKTIVRVIGKQYIWVLLIAFVLGAPLGAMGMMQLVYEVFPDAKMVTALPFVVSIMIMLLTLVITVLGQVNKAINVNPAELLRNE